MAIPKEGYFQLAKGRYGATYPRTPACHGFTIIAKIIPGRDEIIREYGMKTLPQPWTAAMEATIFTGWTYDHLKPHAAAPHQGVGNRQNYVLRCDRNQI